MKRFFVLTALAGLALLVGVSCKQDKKGNAPAVPREETVLVADSLKIECFTDAKTLQLRKDYSVEYSLSVEYVIDDRLPQVVLDSMNCAIGKAMFGKENPQVKSLAIANEAPVREWFEDGIWDGEEDEEEEMYMKSGDWQLSGEFSHTAPKGYTNYNIAGSQYMFGAAHGYYYFTPIVIDLSTGCRLREGQLFREGYQEELSALLLKYLEEEDDYEEGILLWDEGIQPNDNFTIDEDGISYYFNPYEIAAYAYGLIQVNIPARALKPLLADKYAHIWE